MNRPRFRRRWLIALVTFGLLVSHAAADVPANWLAGNSHRINLVSPAVAAPCGDVNQDGYVNDLDIAAVAQAWRAQPPDPAYDVVPDGQIDVKDITFIASNAGHACSGGTRLWGVNMFEEMTDPNARAKVTNAGMNSVRLYIEWRSIEPTNQNLTPQKVTNYDATIATLESDGLIPYLTIQNAPSWAAKYACGPLYGSGNPGDDTYYQEFAELMYALVERYDGDGVDDMPGLLYPIHYFELYNEPDWNGGPSSAPGGCWGSNDIDGDGVNDQKEYAHLLQAIYPAMKAADPSSQLVFGSVAYETYSGSQFNMQFTEKVLSELDNDPNAAANGYYFDVMGFHQYDAFRDNWDGFGYPSPPACGTTWTPLPEPQNLPYNQAVAGKAANLAWILGCHGLSKPMAASEVGLQVTLGGVPPAQRLQKQAHAVVHLLVRSAAIGMPVVSWYTLVDRPSDSLQYGLFNSNWQARPAYTAYTVATGQLLDATFDTQLFPNQTGSQYIQAYRFTAPDGTKKLVLWTDAGCKLKGSTCPDMAVNMTITADVLGVPAASFTGQLQVTSESGSVQFVNIANGSATLTIHQAPVYVQLAP